MDAYMVWDPEAMDEDEADRIEACDHGHAAEIFASDDVDGSTDGIYSGNGHRICVRHEGGTLKKFNVRLEYEPAFQADEIEEP